MVNLTLNLFLDKKANSKTKLQSPTVMIRRFAFTNKCVKTSASDKLTTIKVPVFRLKSELQLSF